MPKSAKRPKAKKLGGMCELIPLNTTSRLTIEVPPDLVNNAIAISIRPDTGLRIDVAAKQGKLVNTKLDGDAARMTLTLSEG